MSIYLEAKDPNKEMLRYEYSLSENTQRKIRRKSGFCRCGCEQVKERVLGLSVACVRGHMHCVLIPSQQAIV